MQEQHLRPVPTDDDAPSTASSTTSAAADDGGDTPPPARPQAAKSRPRPSKALPTDRMKLDAQKRALSVIAILSEYGKHGVGSAEMAPRLDLAPTTAGLNNSFFAEAGLISRDGKGRYKSNEAANEYARKYSFDPEQAGLLLKQPLSETWFFQVVRQQLEGMGPTPKAKLIELLAFEVGATNDHRVQLSTLISWLEYAGLVKIDDGLYKLASDVPAKVEDDDAPAGDDDPAAAEESRPDPKPAGPTNQERPGGQERPAETILGFSFDFALTGEQLALLSPEQITALFKAVGDVMAIQAAATTE